MLKIDNVFNYGLEAIRKQVNDDDQIKSWALQAIRGINLPNLHWVKDIEFLAVVNHQVLLPSFISPERIKSVKGLIQLSSGGYPGADAETVETITTTTSVYTGSNEITMTSVTDVIIDESNGVFNSILSVYNDSTVFAPFEKVMNVDPQYYCKVVGTGGLYYSVTDGMIITNVQEGTIAVQYLRELKEDGDFVFPEQPAVMWEYMAAYVRTRFYLQMVDMGNLEYVRLLTEARMVQANFLTSAKTKLIHSNINIGLLKRLMYLPTNILRLPQVRNHVNQNRASYGS